MPPRPSRTSEVHDANVRRIAAITPDMVRPKPHDSATAMQLSAARESSNNIPIGTPGVRVRIVNANCAPKKWARRYRSRAGF
jgi:hypothetical protein